MNNKIISHGETSIYGVSIELYTGYEDDHHHLDDVELFEITSTLGLICSFPHHKK